MIKLITISLLLISRVSLAAYYNNPTSVTHGGTSASTLTSNNVLLGNGTSAIQFVAPGTSGNVLTSNGTTWQSSPSASGTITPWALDSQITITGAGTIANSKIYSRRVGDSLEVRGFVTYGTISGSGSLAMNLGTYTIDSAKIDSATNTQMVGWVGKVGNGSTNFNTDDAAGAMGLIYDGSDTNNLYIVRRVQSSQYQKDNSSNILGESDRVLSIWGINIPISGW